MQKISIPLAADKWEGMAPQNSHTSLAEAQVIKEHAAQSITLAIKNVVGKAQTKISFIEWSVRTLLARRQETDRPERQDKLVP